MTTTARLAIASQAPGLRAHQSGVPFDDPLGERLRAWLGIGADVLCDPGRLMILPMGFCFPGHDSVEGDLPPRRDCRGLWHDTVLARLPRVETTLAIGPHAICHHLARGRPSAAPQGSGRAVDTSRAGMLIGPDASAHGRCGQRSDGLVGAPPGSKRRRKFGTARTLTGFDHQDSKEPS